MFDHFSNAFFGSSVEGRSEARQGRLGPYTATILFFYRVKRRFDDKEQKNQQNTKKKVNTACVVT